LQFFLWAPLIGLPALLSFTESFAELSAPLMEAFGQWLNRLIPG
jgi:hypothetical protein